MTTNGQIGVCDYFKLETIPPFLKQIENWKEVPVCCKLCGDELDLNKGLEELEKHMKAKHKEKSWIKETSVEGNRNFSLREEEK